MFRLKNLQSKAVALAALFSLFTILQFVLVRVCMSRWSVNENQLNIIHIGQLHALQLSTDVNLFLRGDKSKVSPIVAGVDDLNTQFTLLKEGGVISSNKQSVQPVSRLTQVRLLRSIETWEAYKKSVITITTHEVWKDSVIQESTAPEPSDSTVTETPVSVSQKIMNPEAAQAHALIQGQWQVFAQQFEALAADVNEETASNKQWVLIVMIANVLFTILLFFLSTFIFKRKVLLPLGKIEKAAISRQHVERMTLDELGKVAKGINQVVDQLNQASRFVQDIGEGKLDTVYSEDEKAVVENQLASSLVSMQAKLKTLNDEEQKRQWANEGVAKFVDILRSSNDNLHALGDAIVSTLVHYTGSSQGGLYVLNDEDSQNNYLELISLYAFNIKKYEQQKLKLGEGLVGQAYLEKDTIYLSEIPQDYIRISSGLGGTDPKAILVVPLKVDQQVYGLVELASLKPYQPHEIAFVEKLGETLASTLASVKTNQRTRKLLDDSRLATESMRAQEEEMRQNMEELSATQEEMARKEKDYLVKINGLEEKLAHPSHGDDWAKAVEMERNLQIQLEALTIVREQKQKK